MTRENTLHSGWQDIGGMFVKINERHRFGTDAVLLEDFAKALKKDRVCEIGTGCGIISVLMCKNDRAKSILAVEIQKDAAELACAAKEKNGLDKLEVVCEDANNIEFFDKKIGTGNLDLIVCNPPYYKQKSGGEYSGEDRANCREENKLDIFSLCSFANRFLKFGGRLCVCFKPERLSDLFFAMRQNNIEPKRMRLVSAEIDTAPWLCLVEGKKGAKPYLNISPPLVMNSEAGKKEINEIYGEIRNK